MVRGWETVTAEEESVKLTDIPNKLTAIFSYRDLSWNNTVLKN